MGRTYNHKKGIGQSKMVVKGNREKPQIHTNINSRNGPRTNNSTGTKGQMMLEEFLKIFGLTILGIIAFIVIALLGIWLLLWI